MNCLQPQPIQCRYCQHFFPQDPRRPCSLATGKDAWEEVQRYSYCHSFQPKQEHYRVCGLRMECITGATPKEPAPLRNTKGY